MRARQLPQCVQYKAEVGSCRCVLQFSHTSGERPMFQSSLFLSVFPVSPHEKNRTQRSSSVGIKTISTAPACQSRNGQ